MGSSSISAACCASNISSVGHIVVPAGRRGQHAVAVVGKEDGVDQLRFAARELGDEGHVQPVFAQTFKQLRQAQVALGIGQLVLAQPILEFANVSGKTGAPS